jgi:hypothetical protein
VSIAHVLVVSEFENTGFLRICDIWVVPEACGCLIIDVCITGPFMDVEEVSSDVFKRVLHIIFEEV